MPRALILLGAAIILVECSQKAGNQEPGTGPKGTAQALKPPPDPFGWPIFDRTNKQVGIVTTRLDKAGVAVTVDTFGLPPGLHGVHLHQVAKCQAPSFESAGAHWNWTHKKHGHKNPQGYHAGDLGNLTVGPDGKGQAAFLVPSKDWEAKGARGLPLVIHAHADDDKTDPSGNSGERIACGVLYLRQD